MKRLKYTFTIVLVAAFALGLAACDDFLDKEPSKSNNVVASTIDHLDKLLNDPAVFYRQESYTLLTSTDDFTYFGYLHNRWKTYYPEELFYFLFDHEYLQLNDSKFWVGEYNKIFYANMVLFNLDYVDGTVEQKAALKAECHFIRAYSYHELAQVYCLPYTEATKNELGLPLKRGLSFEETNHRGTLEETYKLIESDLEEALKTTATLGSDRCIWRISKEAVNAFAARYYLGQNNYEEALKYANAALSSHSKLFDYNTEMTYANFTDTRTVTNNDDGTTFQVFIQYPSSYEPTDMRGMLAWEEFYYLRVMYNAANWYLPSQELLGIYQGENDLRYKWHMILDYSYRRPYLNNTLYHYPGYVFFGWTDLPSGPTTAEMVLTKAECQARLGNYQDAMNTVNVLRAKRMDNTLSASEINLSAASKAEAITKILEERRREIPFSIRWFDIRRYNTNDDPADDIDEITRSFFPYTAAGPDMTQPEIIYTLKKGSRRFATPIPNADVVSSGGKVLQNTY